MDHGLRMDLRDARLRDFEHALDFLERQAFKVVQGDDGALLRRKLVDGLAQRVLDLLRLDDRCDVGALILQCVDERNLVTLLVREKLLERKNRRPLDPQQQIMELGNLYPEVRGHFRIGSDASEASFELLIRALQLARALAHSPGNPVERAKRVENGSIDASDRIRFKLDSARIVVLLDGVDQAKNALVDEVENLDVGRKID